MADVVLYFESGKLAWEYYKLININQTKMKSILVINDHSPAAHHAAQLALSIAQKVKADLMLLNVNIPVKVLPANEYELVPESMVSDYREWTEPPLTELLIIQNKEHKNFGPEIRVIDTALFSNEELTRFVNKQEIWMVVKGVPGEEAFPLQSADHIQAILNKVRCPMMLVPEIFKKKEFERMVYTVDLRYCKLEIVRYLAQLAAPFNASLLIAHIPACGLPDMEQDYALSIFNKEISNRVKYDKLLFDHITEKNLEKVFDVLTNGMDADLLAVVNHRFHFEKIVRQYKNYVLPSHITIPLLVFPC
jgi:nucleotide-binding universal stress UspA family protein